MKILKDDLDRYKQSPWRVFKHSFYLVLVLLVVWEFADPTPAVKAQVEKSAPAKVWTESEKQVIYKALAKFCLAQRLHLQDRDICDVHGFGQDQACVESVISAGLVCDKGFEGSEPIMPAER